MWVGYGVGCTMRLTLGHGAWQIDQPSNGSMWNSYSFQPVGQWMGYSFTDLGAEGCCRSLNALLFVAIFRDDKVLSKLACCFIIVYIYWLPWHAIISAPPAILHGCTVFTHKFCGYSWQSEVWTKWLTFGKQHFQMCFFCGILIIYSLTSVPKDPTDDKSVLISIMVWCLASSKPLPEPMMTKSSNRLMGQCKKDITPVR